MDKYQSELDAFRRNFQAFSDKRIALYGIGRMTATLLDKMRGFSFVALLDKNPDSEGKEMLGVPVVSLRKAEEIADIIIINTSETYWDVIYARIQDSKIPVYYKNGAKAEKKSPKLWEHPFRLLSVGGLLGAGEKAEIISFDFFDTLFMRRVASPSDVALILEAEFGKSWAFPSPYSMCRNRAKESLDENYSLDSLYTVLAKSTGLPEVLLEAMKKREIELEKTLLVPRDDVLGCMRTFLEAGKDVYVISDMYLPKSFYADVLSSHGIKLAEGRVLLSNVLRRSKKSGSLWDCYAKEIIKGRPALHIGDDSSDIEKPKEYGISTYPAPSAYELLGVSSLAEAASAANTLCASQVLGLVIARLLNSPYTFSGRDAAVKLEAARDMGYAVFGPVILTFLLWLLQKQREDGVGEFLFLSRDGYFLKEDFEFLCGMAGRQVPCKYVGISRQLAMVATIETDDDLMQYLHMPYSGSVKELFEDRLGLSVDADGDATIESCASLNKRQIDERVSIVQEKYRKYIAALGVGDKPAVVDSGYYGNNQLHLGKLLRRELPGYYFVANLSELNPNTRVQKMSACFQSDDDKDASSCDIFRKMIYLESFLTAPYGMVREVDWHGNFVSAPSGGNQKYFSDKEEMNRGVKEFIGDFIRCFGADCKLDAQFVNSYYGLCFGGGVGFSDAVKRSFYNDNAMMNRFDTPLFQ